MNEVRLEWMRPSEVLAAQAEKSIIYVPIGPLEWHGPHLPLGTDPLMAQRLALELARKSGGVVYPVLYWGTEREFSPDLLRDLGFSGDEWIVGMDFPANSVRSFYSAEEQFSLVVRGVLESLIAHNFRLIVVVNGHGATDQIYHLQRLVAELNARGPARLLYTFTLGTGVGDPGHATITETSAIMALDESRVDLASLPGKEEPLHYVDYGIVEAPTFKGQPTPGQTVRPEYDPRIATPAEGQAHFARAVEQLSRLIDETYHSLPARSPGHGRKEVK